MEKRWTHRQLLVAYAWINMQWNEPSRSDHYLMQIARECNAYSKKQRKPEYFRIKFRSESDKEQPKMTKEEATRLSQAVWIPHVAVSKSGKPLPVRVVKKGLKEPNEE